MKKFRLLSLLLVATLFTQNAAAALLPYIPYSSHYHGRSYFSDSNTGVTGHVDFAVYDRGAAYGDEWVGAGFDPPGTNQYVYAYQIFNDTGSPEAIEYFTIMGLGTLHHLVGIDTMNTQNPWEFTPYITEGVAPINPNPNASPGETTATWEFGEAALGGGISAGDYSWFLIFSSPNDWVRGQYQTGTAGGIPITGNPEPCTLALLGLGSVILLAKRRNSVKSYGVHLHN
jgi:hypothetical protein